MEAPSNHTAFNLYYSRTLDQFELVDRIYAGTDGDDPEDDENISFAELYFDFDQNPGEYVLFDNDEPGRILKIVHEGGNERAIALLSNTVLGKMYEMVCECFREGTTIYNETERERTLLVPYTQARMLATVALHASAEYTTDKVIELHKRLTADGGDAGGADRRLSA